MWSLFLRNGLLSSAFVVVVGLIHQQHWFLARDLACEAKKEIAERDVCVWTESWIMAYVVATKKL